MIKKTDTNSLPFDALSSAWSKAGRGLAQPGMPHCMVNDCYAMAFVGLRTVAGNRAVCFRHYVQMDEAGL